jgi:hypothetical protein
MVLHVLFIGNSHTHYNSMVKTIEEFAPQCIRAMQIAPGGATLQVHLNNAATVAAIHDGPDGPGGTTPWDWVVLQPNSVEQFFVYPGGLGSAAVNKALYHSAGVQLAALARNGANGPAKVMLYPVWAKGYPWEFYTLNEFDTGNDPKTQAALIDASSQELKALVEADGGTLDVVPIVQGWLGGARVAFCGQCRRAPCLPEDSMFRRFQFPTPSAGDWSHATPIGSYLVAVMLFRALTGCCTLGLPPITGAPDPRQPDWDAGQRGLVVTSEFARCAQTIADMLVDGEKCCRCDCGCRRRGERGSWRKCVCDGKHAKRGGEERVAEEKEVVVEKHEEQKEKPRKMNAEHMN